MINFILRLFHFIFRYLSFSMQWMQKCDHVCDLIICSKLTCIQSRKLEHLLRVQFVFILQKAREKERKQRKRNKVFSFFFFFVAS